MFNEPELPKKHSSFVKPPLSPICEKISSLSVKEYCKLLEFYHYEPSPSDNELSKIGLYFGTSREKLAEWFEIQKFGFLEDGKNDDHFLNAAIGEVRNLLISKDQTTEKKKKKQWNGQTHRQNLRSLLVSKNTKARQLS